jgi:hypothetical protein
LKKKNKRHIMRKDERKNHMGNLGVDVEIILKSALKE